MNALLLIDVQYDFLPGGALAVTDGDQIIPVLNHIQKHFDLVAATQDWHPKDHGSFASNHEGKNPFDTIILGGLDQILWPDHCVQGEKGSEFSSQLNMQAVEAIFRKGTDRGIDSYSGFFDNGKKKIDRIGRLSQGKRSETCFCGRPGCRFLCWIYSTRCTGIGIPNYPH